MIHLLIWLLVLVLVLGVIWYALQLLPLPHPFNVIAQLILLVIFVVVLVSVLMPFAGGPAVLR